MLREIFPLGVTALCDGGCCDDALPGRRSSRPLLPRAFAAERKDAVPLGLAPIRQLNCSELQLRVMYRAIVLFVERAAHELFDKGVNGSTSIK